MRDERREKKETSTTKMRRSKDAMVRSQEGRDGTERVRSLRGKREESREKREERQTSTTKISRSKDAMVRSQNGGMVQKRVGP